MTITKLYYTKISLPRTSNPTVESHRKNYRILLDPIGIHRKLSESLVSNSDLKSLDVGKCWNGPVFCRNPEIPAFSDIRQLPVGIRY